MSSGRSGGFVDFRWQESYRTSEVRSDGSQVDILREFYVPALSRSVEYLRVAGFFTSSSLAVASQGFSSFTEGGGSMRLIVGADLDPADVEAILKGDEERLSLRLQDRLRDSGRWPKEESRGVELLAWMVARGVLEVKVAFRVRSGTREPLPFDSAEGGYVHEKWALFRDRHDRWLMASGSLNESRTALVRNAENITLEADWWAGPSAGRIGKHREDFEVIWGDEHRYLRVLPLPEAVRERLISFSRGTSRPVELDGRPGLTGPAPSPLEWLRFSLIKAGPTLPGGLYVGMETAPVAPWPHQRVVARRLVDSWPMGYLLCDEVGLGKTIEAGLAFRSLVLSKVAKRIMIAAPAGLVEQWRREMADKFYLDFYVDNLKSDPLSRPLSLVSTGILQRKDRAQAIKEAPLFDMVLLDEAHYARRREIPSSDPCRSYPDYGGLYKTVRDLLRERTRSLSMATATPMQLSWIEAYDLLLLTDRVGAFGGSPSLVDRYYDSLKRFRDDGRLSDGDEMDFLQAVSSSISSQDPTYLWFLNQCFSGGRLDDSLKRLWSGRRLSRDDLSTLERYLFAVAPLSRVMLRHTRDLLRVYGDSGLLDRKLAVREILPVPDIRFSPDEKKVYDDLERYCADLFRKISSGKTDESRKKSLGFYLSLLRQRFASSVHALLKSLERRLEKVERSLGHYETVEELEQELLDERFLEDDESPEDVFPDLLKDRTVQDLKWEADRLRDMLETIKDLSFKVPSKVQYLLSVLDGRRSDGRVAQTVIFTRYVDTLEDLLSHIKAKDRKMRLGTYTGRGCSCFTSEGGMERVDRETVKRRFLSGDIDVLLCTDAAAEGLNLQTADMLINFDLPWNPMKVEQRVGRIDRIGQRHDRIEVLNLCYVDSVERIIYDRLMNRFSQSISMVGTMPFSLLPVSQDEFDDLASGRITVEQLEVRSQARLIEQREQAERMEMGPRERFDLYRSWERAWDREVLPVDLKDIWESIVESSYLKELGGQVASGTKGKVFVLRGIFGIPNGTCLTVDRELFERGVEGLPGPLHFATYGDRVFDRLLEHLCEDFQAPSGIVPMEEVFNARPGVLSGFALFDGERVRTVASFEDLRSIDKVVPQVVPKEEVHRLSQRLPSLERRDPGQGPFPDGISERILNINRKAKRAQLLLEMELAASLVGSLVSAGHRDEERFSEAKAFMDQSIGGKKSYTLPRVDLRWLRKAGDFLFPLSIPSMGEEGAISMPSTLIKSVLDRVARESDAIHKSQSAITISMVKERLWNQLSKIRSDFD